MLARHAESMFWAGRYLERCEDTARMLDATLRSSVSVGPEVATQRYRALLATLRLEDPGGPMTLGTLLTMLVASPESPGSLVSAVRSTRENLRSLREQVPSELWEQTNRLHLWLSRPEFVSQLRHDPFAELESVKEQCQTIAGIITTAMMRDEGHLFLALGQTIERAVMTCRLVHVGYPQLSATSYDHTALMLRSASALEAYQREFRSSPAPTQVARFLLLSDRFPRALLFNLQEAEQQVQAIGGTGGGTNERNRPLRLLGQVRSKLEFIDFDEMLLDVEGVTAEFEEQIRGVAFAVATHYFRHADPLDRQAQHLLPGESA